VLQGDGVVPVSQLSFTKAEEAHFKGAKKMGDVRARSAMNDYFDHLGEEQQAEHKAALKRSFTKFNGGQSLNQWFNKMGQKYFRETEAEHTARKASHPGKLAVHRQVVYQQPQVAAAAAEDPDDVPMEKKESVEDKMIQAVADYQQEQKEAQAKKFARDNAKVKKQIADVKKVEVEEATKAAAEAAKEEADETAERAAVKKVKEEEEHFKKMRLEAEETAEVQQAKALRDYKAKIAAKEAKAEELQKEAKAEQRKALADYEEAQKAKAKAAKMPVEAREKKMRQSVKAVEAAEDKAAEEKAETHLAKEKREKAARDAAKAAAAKRDAERAAKHAKYEARAKEEREKAKAKAEERKEERTERKIKREHERKAKQDKFKAEIAKKAEERNAVIAKNHRDYEARKAAEKGKLAHNDNVPLAAAVKRAEKIQEEDKVEAPMQIKKSSAGEKVKIGFYMESMCPGCKYYTKNVLGKLMEKPEFVSMVDFELYPYGNGQLAGDSISCQHGEKECEGNTILACMQELYPITSDSTGFVPAFVCMEAENGVPKDDFAKCAAQHDIDQAKVMACAQGDQGKQLALAAAKNTEALNPPHEYAPWVTMNGQPMRDSAYDLQASVCKAFDAGDGPASELCSKSSLSAVAKKDRAMLHDGGGRGFSVCHKDVWE